MFGLSSRVRFDVVINMFIGMGITTRKIVLNSDGNAWRPNVHILDVCQAFEKALQYENNEKKPLVLNVGSTKNNYKIIDLANFVKENIPGCEINFLAENICSTLAIGLVLIVLFIIPILFNISNSSLSVG